MPNPTEFHFKDSFIVVLEFFFPNPRLIFHSRDWSQFYTSPSQNFVSRKIRIHTTTSSLTPPEILISRFIQTPTLHQKRKKSLTSQSQWNLEIVTLYLLLNFLLPLFYAKADHESSSTSSKSNIIFASLGNRSQYTFDIFVFLT